MKAKNYILISALMGTLISGCGGGGGTADTPPPAPTDPLAVYKSQKITWGSCDSYFSKYSDSGQEIYISKLGDRLQCTDIDAPLDYNKPDDLKIKISMMRVQAADNADKKPHLFFNPGGPGVDGLNYSLIFSLILSMGNPKESIGSIYKKVSDSYNFIGFSPRGVGASTNISCAGNQLIYPTNDTAAGENSENIKRITEIAKYTAINCQKNPVSDYINTDTTSRDMDLMRHLLGDEKMHYYGISYGTWLGFWYAGIFPDKVGPMVLDSNMNFSQSIHQAGISYEQGKINTFNNFIVPYAARHNDAFELGTTPQEIIKNLNDFHPITKQILVNTSFRAEPKSIASALMNTKLLQISSDGLKANLDLRTISTNMQNTVIETGNKNVNESKSEAIEEIIQEIYNLQKPNYWYTPVKFPVSDHVFDTVVCNDEFISNNDPIFWINTGFELARTLPIVPNRIASQPCLSWKRNATFTKPAIQSLKASKLMMVQSQYDVPTPLSGAMETFNQLPATSMVYVKNEGSHGLMLYGTECVDLTVMNYLLGQAPADRLTTCEGKPMELDKLAATSTVKASAGQRKASSQSDPANNATSNFENPELARKLIERLRAANNTIFH